MKNRTPKGFSKKQLTVLSWWHEKSEFSSYDGIICDGAVRSGKTTCMSLSFVLWAFYEFDDCNFALCAKTITSLRRNILTSLLENLRSIGFVCEEKISQNLVTIKKGKKTNRFYLFGGRDESSAALIQGITLTGVLFDEAALMPRSFIEQAVARCSPEKAKFWFNCNPETPYHWFYEEWIKKAEEKNCLYLSFRMTDNPSLSKKVIKRYEKLYSGAFYERYVLGKWVSVQGLVYPQAADGKYTLMPPQKEASRYLISCDYGTVNPFSAGLWGEHDGHWFRQQEYYFSSKREGRQQTDEEYYTELEKLAAGKKIEAVIVDPSAASFIECIRRHGKFKAVAAKNDVVYGIHAVSEAFESGKIFISPVCRDTLREFGLYRWEENAAKDCVKKENDHAMDDIRYFVSTYLRTHEDVFFASAAERSI
ncbi:MAG: PBSX family phage terminase large subunit [Acutalibacteraceae bacterium]